MKDAQGYKVSGATASAVGYFDQAVRAFSLGFGDIVGLFDSARTSAPEFAMAHLGKAWVLMLANDPTMMVAARPLIAAARALELNQREEAHLAAVEQAVEGNRTAAVRILDRHLMSYPFDLLGHFAALFLDALSGRFPWVAERSSRALPVWSKSQPGYGILLAFYAFGIEEGGQYALAEENARRAAELEPNCYWAHHAIAHVMEMTGRPEDGLKWTAAHESNWSTDEHPARVHIWWHNALFHLEMGDNDRALQVYDGPIRASQKPLGFPLTNASALLWRLEMLGWELGDRWQELARLWEGHADGKVSVFTDIHAAMAELRAGEMGRFDRRLAQMRRSAASNMESSENYRDIGLPVIEGLSAFSRGDYVLAVEHILPARFDLWKMGGSKAQRDVVDWTLAEAAVRAGERDVALAMAHERLSSRPSSIPNTRMLSRAVAALDPSAPVG